MMFMNIRSMVLYVICLLHVYVCYMLLYVICLLYVILLYVICRRRVEHIVLCRHPHFFFLDFNNPVPKGTLRISGKKKLICQRYVHTTTGTKISSSNIWGGNTGLIPENII
jgi:hypothetical protein